MRDRRDFLKYFGIGATIVPLVAGMPRTDVSAKLIEVPKADIEIAQPLKQSLNPYHMTGRKVRMQVHFVDEDNRRWSLEGQALVLGVAMETIDVTNHTSGFRHALAIPAKHMNWEIRGQLLDGVMHLPSGTRPASARAR